MSNVTNVMMINVNADKAEKRQSLETLTVINVTTDKADKRQS